MKNSYIFFIFFFVLTFSLSAQTFEKYIQHPYDEQMTLNSISLDDGSFIIGSFENDLANPRRPTIFYKLDSTGQIIDSLVFYKSVELYEFNNQLYFFGKDTSPSSTATMVAGKVDQNTLNVTQSISLFHPLAIQGIVVLHAEFLQICDCITLTGTTIDTLYQAATYIMQIDTNLNLLNFQLYYRADMTSHAFYQIMENASHDTIIALGPSLDTLPPYNTATLTFLDSSLKVDTTRTVKLITDSIGSYNIPVQVFPNFIGGTRLTDTSYLFAGRALIFVNRNIESDITYTITDENFNSKSWHFYGKKPDTVDFPGVRVVDKYKHHVYISSLSDDHILASYPTYLGLTKVDLEGNLLWTKYYRNRNHNLSPVLTATKDGGALLVSKTHIISKNTQEYDIYILKVDSNGNLQQTVGLEEKKVIDDVDYSIYPNPTKNQLNFQKFNYFHSYEVRLFDTFGREVMYFDWLEDQKTISIAALTSGVYIYRIIDEKGRMASGKIVKE